MKKIILTFLVLSTLFTSVNAATLDEQQKELQKLDERITDIELNSLKNKVNFGLDLRIDSAYMADTSQISGKNRTSHSGYVGTVFFRLNMSASIAENVSVYTSAESLSYFNETVFNNSASSNSRENQDKGEKITISKAYFDWRFYKNWLTFTGGRLPTTQGPPAHIKDGMSREGTYPVTGYSIPLDGFALTAKLSTPMEIKDNLSFRFIYKPGGATRTNMPYRGADLGDYSHPEKVAKHHELYSAMLEYEQTENTHKLWGKMLAIIQFGSYKFGSPQAFQSTGLNGGNDYELYRVYFDKDKLIDATILSPYIEINKAFNIPLDLYATMSITKSESHAKARAVILTGAGAGVDIAVGPFLHSGKATGKRIITGARYEFANRFFMGAEYMKSNEKSLPTVFHTNSSLSPSYLNGKSYEVYFLKNIYNNNFLVRLGYTYIDVNADLSNGLFFRDTVEKINVVNLTFDFRI